MDELFRSTLDKANNNEGIFFKSRNHGNEKILYCINRMIFQDEYTAKIIKKKYFSKERKTLVDYNKCFKYTHSFATKHWKIVIIVILVVLVAIYCCYFRKRTVDKMIDPPSASPLQDEKLSTIHSNEQPYSTQYYYNTQIPQSQQNRHEYNTQIPQSYQPSQPPSHQNSQSHQPSHSQSHQPSHSQPPSHQPSQPSYQPSHQPSPLQSPSPPHQPSPQPPSPPQSSSPNQNNTEAQYVETFPINATPPRHQQPFINGSGDDIFKKYPNLYMVDNEFGMSPNFDKHNIIF